MQIDIIISMSKRKITTIPVTPAVHSDLLSMFIVLRASPKKREEAPLLENELSG